MLGESWRVSRSRRSKKYVIFDFQAHLYQLQTDFFRLYSVLQDLLPCPLASKLVFLNSSQVRIYLCLVHKSSCFVISILGFVEIGQVATKRNISTLLEYAKDPTTRADLETMLTNYNLKEGHPHNSSVLELLEKYTDIDIPLGTFIACLPSMRLRQYSISSSPLWNPSHVTLTVGVVAQGQFLGVASNYLANLHKGDRVQLAVRPSSKGFHPPSDPSVPMVLFAAGSGMAPFRGFLQERATQAQAGRQVAKSVLFFGCRKPDEDYLYSDKELAEWKELGIVDLRPTFSRAPEQSEGHKYVQE